MTPAIDEQKRLEEMLARLGWLDGARRVGRVWELEQGGTTVAVQVAPPVVAVMAELEVAAVGVDLMRRLLSQNRALGGAFYGLSGERGLHVARVLPLRWLDEQDLAEAVRGVASRAAGWRA